MPGSCIRLGCYICTQWSFDMKMPSFHIMRLRNPPRFSHACLHTDNGFLSIIEWTHLLVQLEREGARLSLVIPAGGP
jgi:hypothetical protein